MTQDIWHRTCSWLSNSNR